MAREMPQEIYLIPEQGDPDAGEWFWCAADRLDEVEPYERAAAIKYVRDDLIIERH